MPRGQCKEWAKEGRENTCIWRKRVCHMTHSNWPMLYNIGSLCVMTSSPTNRGSMMAKFEWVMDYVIFLVFNWVWLWWREDEMQFITVLVNVMVSWRGFSASSGRYMFGICFCDHSQQSLGFRLKFGLCGCVLCEGFNFNVGFSFGG